MSKSIPVTSPVVGASAQSSPSRSVGIWMVGFLVAYMLFNTVRAMLSPVDFAANYGVPLASAGNDGFVLVYAIRALFLGLFGLALLLRRNYGALALYALVAAVMPVGDALLVASKAGPTATVIRHALTAGFLVLTWFMLRRWLQKTS